MKMRLRCMGIILSALSLLLAVIAARAADPKEPPMHATALRCEYLVNPLGIDVIQPRLSWIVESAGRGQKQTAYQVLVASHEATLRQDQGDLWDSGKVSSDETITIPYGGKPLVSHQRCYWKVKVWDRDGEPSPWSESALWTMGLLTPAEWTAEWIGYDKPREQPLPEAPFEGAQWIGFPGDKGKKTVKGTRLFVTTFTLPDRVRVDQAELLITADGHVSFHLGDKLLLTGVPTPEPWKHPQVVDVARHLKPGANDIRVSVTAPAKRLPALLVKLQVLAGDGKTYTLVSDGTWKTTDQTGPSANQGALETSKWPASEVLGEYGAAPWGKLKHVGEVRSPASYLRHVFRVAKPVRHATLYATALGVCDLHLNGKRVTDDRFNPGWTDYRKRVYYRAYDVTGLLRPGDNALGAVLADGWFSGYIGYHQDRDHYGKQPRFGGLLHIVHADGSTAEVVTGPGWKASTGPIREADFLLGEAYDARRVPKGWDEPGFGDGQWDQVVTGTARKPVVQHHPGPPVTVCGEFRTKTITESAKGVYVLDLGQNFAGVARLSVSGDPGQTITLRFAERLNPDGTIYTTNLRTARATDTYVCRGRGVEVWEPRFTFHGFQYVEIDGLRSPPAQDTITGLALSSDTPITGKFTCSDPMLNRLHDNIYWTQRSNFIDIPTDCPQRDERLGWTGDAQVYVRTATLNADVQTFFTKWLVDLEDGQRADGQFPMVAPVKVAGDDGGPAWADAGAICPWTIYEVYGDRRELERHYPSMTRFIEFCRKRSTPELLPPKQYHCFGDWLSIKADTPKDVIYTAYFAHSTQLTARAAEVLGRKEDAARYQDLFEKIKAAFNKAYVGADGRIKGNTQACYVLALAFDLLDAEKQKLAARYLVEDIEAKSGHLSTGFIGTKDLMLVLAKIGRDDVAYRLLQNDTFPSWGFSIKHGATSIWERWDGWTPEHGFQDPGMNSFAHYSFGAVYQWMVENIGGIRTEGPAYQRIVIAPQPGGRLRSADTTFRSIHGTIETHWKKEGGRLLLTVIIPANTTATVFVPAGHVGDVTEGGRPLDTADGVKVLRVEGERVVLAVGSGTYQFAMAMK